FYVRVFFDEKPFSTEVYAIHPRLDITTNAGIVSAPYVLTRCAPKGEYAVRYEALGYIPMPIGHGRIEVIRGTAEYIYAHPSDYPDAQGEMLWTITESELKVVPTISAKNILHNFALIFLCLLALLVFAALLVLFILVYKNKRK
ncbi:MAG: hypothetical protein HYW88_02450, partial [Candidatus Sungbacteria bacterium]|nr:hypothetical protein [Candidatus Sungbacteria bacterium]